MTTNTDIFEKKVSLPVRVNLTLDQLSHLITSSVDIDDMPKFIAMLDSDCENWDITEKLIKHYKHLEEVYIKEEIDTDEKLEPKNIFEYESR